MLYDELAIKYSLNTTIITYSGEKTQMGSNEIIPIMSGDATFKERNKILTSGSFKLIYTVAHTFNS